MDDSLFYNSHGLELSSGLGNISSSYDLAMLTKYAMQNETFRNIFKTKEYRCKTNFKEYKWLNKNKLLKYDYVSGGKTGYTIKAKRTLVSTANIHNQEIVIVTLNDPNDFNDHHYIYENINNNFVNYRVISKDYVQKELNNLNIGCFTVNSDYYLFINKNDVDKIKTEYHFNNKVGYIRVIYENSIVHEEPIYECVIKKVPWYKKIFQRISNLFN
jgi:D-alanyl-D-alanine carboxypeptidase